MPNFDGGHYFLTALVPVRTDAIPGTALKGDPVWHGYAAPVSHVEHLRGTLATLPTASQTPAWEAIPLNSPFARNRRTHLTRMVVIEDPMYNGRISQDAIRVALTGINPVNPQPVDKLTCPFLMWAIEFDPIDPDKPSPSEPESYLCELWEQMEDELRAVFTHCVGFDEQVRSAKDFARYIQRCQLETTMPFNDYWITAPPFPSMSKTLKVIAVPAAISAVAFVGGLIAWILCGMFGMDTVLWMKTAQWATVTVCGLTALAVIVAFTLWLVTKNAAKPFATAPNSDLRSVLKAIYLQQAFTTFATDNQGVDADALYKAFGDFIATHQPNDLNQPTQSPGVVRSQPPQPQQQPQPQPERTRELETMEP